MSSSQSNPGFTDPSGAGAPGAAKPRDTSMARNIVGVLCPYCASVSADIRRCNACGGHFDPLSRQATQNDMGPWFLFDKDHPTRPGCSYEKIRELALTGKIRPGTIIRGPTTKQFWSFASRAPSIANLVGYCHNCQGRAGADDYSCKSCGSVFSPETDRQHLGLAPVRLLPGRDSPAVIAAREFSPRDLGPEPAVLDAPASAAPRVIEPKAARSLPGASFLPPTPEELATLAQASPAPIAPPAKVEIAVPMARSVASVPTVKARPVQPAPATNNSAAWDLGSLDNDRGSGGAWWWVAAVAMLALGAGIAYIAWSQSNPGRRYLSTPSTVAKGAAPTKQERSPMPAPVVAPMPTPPETEPSTLAPSNPPTQDAGTPTLPAPVVDQPDAKAGAPSPPQREAPSGDAMIDTPDAGSVELPAATEPPPSIPASGAPALASATDGAHGAGDAPTPASEPTKEAAAVQAPAVSPASEVTPEASRVNPSKPALQPRESESAIVIPDVKPSGEAPLGVAPEPGASAPSVAPSEAPQPSEPSVATPGDATREIQREVLAAVASAGAGDLDGDRFFDAWTARAGGESGSEAAGWLAKVRATLDRWRTMDRIGRSLP